MKILFSEKAWEEYLYWQKNDRAMLKRINLLLREITRDPHSGMGKPERLRYDLSGMWSRRIDQEHRLVCQISDEVVRVVSCKYHYDP